MCFAVLSARLFIPRKNFYIVVMIVLLGVVLIYKNNLGLSVKKGNFSNAVIEG